MSILTPEFCKIAFEPNPITGQIEFDGLPEIGTTIYKTALKIDEFEDVLKEQDPNITEIRENTEERLKYMNVVKERIRICAKQCDDICKELDIIIECCDEMKRERESN